MKKSFYWSVMLVAVLFAAGILVHKSFAQEGPTQPEASVESAPVVEPENGSDDQGNITDSEEGDSEEGDSEEGDSEEGDESDDLSDEGEVEGAAFSAFRRHDDDEEEVNHDNPKVDICHWEPAQGGKWTPNNVSIDAIFGNGNKHGNHQNDIIPAFDYWVHNQQGWSLQHYNGKHWDEEGQATWSNNCQVPPETGSITIVKQVVGAGDQEVPTEWSFDFSGGLGVFSLTNADNSETEDDLKPGEYTVTEGGLGDNWTLTDVSCEGGEVSENGASVNINLGEDGNVTCTFTNTYRKPEVPPTTTTIHAQKIICDEESDLPNWGAGGPDITSTTASDWLAAHPDSGCHLADWDFEWSYRNVAGDPDDNTPGFLGGNWYPFANGEAIVDVANDGQLGIREVFDEDYIPFTGQNTNEDVSAEMYCGDDVLHYDNWEWINATAGQPIYCVAWNVPLEKEEACRVQVVSDDTSIVVGPNVPAVEILAHPAWSALISAASWIWDAKDENGNPSGNGIKTFEKTFFHTGPVNSAVLDVASDNGFEVWINGVQVPGSAPEATDEFNYTSAGQNQYDVSGMSFVDGLNTLTVRVNDWGVVGGGLYKLVINAEEEKLCEEPPVDTTSDVTICKYQNSVSEQNGLSDWTVWLDEKTIVNDDTIVVDDSHDYSGETAENGCVTFKGVEFGDYTIGEDMPDGWQNVVDADGAVAAGSVVDVNDTTEIFNLVNTLSCNPEVNLIKNSGFENPVVVANGGGWEQFVNGTPLLEWVADFVDTTTDAPLEIQSGYSGWVGHDGSEQYAELDSTAPTTVSQDVPTTPGNTYRLTYWRAARPGTEPTNNANRALVDGVEVDSNVFASVGGNPDWYPSPVIEFTATNAVTNIAFKDDGSSADSLGTFIDDVGLYCIPPVEEHHNHVTICKAEVGHDGYLSGWTVGLNKYQGPQPEVEIVADTNEYEGVTGENGCITFDDVDLGQYLVNEVMQPGWEFFSGPVGPQNIDSDQGDYHFYITNQQTQGGDDDDDDNGGDDASIAGYKWNDLNSDADDEEGGEPRLSNWPIELYGTNDGWYLLASTTTDELGYYSFGELNGGTYAVCEGDVSGWTQTYPIGESYPDNCHIVSIEDGEDAAWYPFGNHQNPEVTGDDDDDDNGPRPSSHRHSGSSSRGEVLGATTDTNFCPFLRDYQHINMQNDPSEVNKAKAFFNAYLGLGLTLNGIFDQSMFNAVVQFQNMFKPDVLDTWTEEYPGVLNDNATGYLYQTTKWKINSIICPGYETFPDKLIIAPGTTVN